MAMGLALAGLSHPAMAQTPGALTYDTTQPIDVEADSLEVREEGRTAIFTGHVKAVQGDLELSASEIRVYYRRSAEGSAEATEGLIARIDANGAVTISTKAETASGDWAIYDVDQKILTLGGAVQIERGENKVQGQRLVLDLASGQTRIESGTSGDGRVRGVFSPSTTEGGNETE
jgi:lipopolysaccharide export system protein LptA